MSRALIYILVGYLLGGLLFARLWGRVLHGRDVAVESGDGNPGAANAFSYGGFFCGMLTLVCDIGKGTLPVWLYLRGEAPMDLWLAPLLAAPVIGHAFPLIHGFHGGKGIAVSFGVLIGLLPYYQPLVILALSFLFFSLVVVVQPNFYRTLAAFSCAAVVSVLWLRAPVGLGMLLVALVVFVRMGMSKEEKPPCQVKLLWKS